MTDPPSRDVPRKRDPEEAGALERVDRSDALRDLEAAERRASRHLTWMVLGLSPAAIIPLVGLLIEGSVELLWVLFGLVFLVEGARYLMARSEVERLREVVKRLSSAHADAIADPFEEGDHG